MSKTLHLRSLLVAGASVAAFTAMASPAFAQATTTTIEELVVTAEKREQSLQDVPVAVSAFTSKTRDLVGINTVQDLTNFTPGFVYSAVNDRASMRGVGRLTNIHSVDGAIAIYIDGLYTTSTVFAGAPPLMTDRVEVLRGPQGTLYGRNSIGGTVNIISRRPTEQAYAEVRAIVENYGFTNFQAAISGPVTDNLQFRLSGYKLDQTKGYYENVNPNMPTEGAVRDEYAVELQLQGQLGENADFWIKYGDLRWDNRGGPGARSGYLAGSYETGRQDPNFSIIYNPVHGYSPETGVNGIVPGSLQQFNGGTTTTNPAQRDAHKINTNTPIFVGLTDVHLLTANFNYHAPTFDVKYIGGISNYAYNTTGDLDNSNVKSYQIPLQPGSVCGTVGLLFSLGASSVNCGPLTVDATATYHYFEKPKWFSNEINISSTTDSPLQWIFGLYQFEQSYSATNTLNGFSSQPQMKTPILGAAPNPTGAFSISEYDLTTKSRAIFGQLDWQATDTLKFTAGLRYTEDEKAGSETRRVVCFSDVCFPGLYPALGLSGFGPGTAANYGSLLGNLNALPAVGAAFGLGGALNGLAGLGNGAFDLTTALAPTTTAAGAKGVTSPVVATATPGVFIQYKIASNGNMVRQLGGESDAVTGTLGAQWEPDSDTMAYARYSRGYKAFGLSAGGGLAEPYANPEFVDSIEVGLKKNFATLQVNAAVYHYKYTDLQAPVTARVGATNVTQFINVPESRSQGLELDAIWAPTQALRLIGSYSFNDTEITQSGLYVDVNDNITTGAVSVKGNTLPQAPRNKFALNASYSFVMEPGTLTLGATYVWRDKAYANIFERSYNESQTWDQIDLRANWNSQDGRYAIIGYVKNVADTEGYDAAVAASNRNRNPAIASDNFANGALNLGLTPPRTYGVEFQYKFF